MLAGELSFQLLNLPPQVLDPASNLFLTRVGGLLSHITTNGFIDLVIVHRHFLGSFYTQSHFVPADLHDNHRNVIVGVMTDSFFLRVRTSMFGSPAIEVCSCCARL